MAELGCGGLMTYSESLKPTFFVEQWELNGSKNNFAAKGDVTLR